MTTELVAEYVTDVQVAAEAGSLAGQGDFENPANFGVPHHAVHDTGSDLVPILGIVFVFGAPVLIVAMVMLASIRKTRLQHETIGRFVENGLDIPPDLYERLNPKPDPRANLRRGALLAGAGIGLGLAGVLMLSTEVGAVALVVLSVGVAMLLIWRLENRI